MSNLLLRLAKIQLYKTSLGPYCALFVKFPNRYSGQASGWTTEEKCLVPENATSFSFPHNFYLLWISARLHVQWALSFRGENGRGMNLTLSTPSKPETKSSWKINTLSCVFMACTQTILPSLNFILFLKLSFPLCRLYVSRLQFFFKSYQRRCHKA